MLYSTVEKWLYAVLLVQLGSQRVSCSENLEHQLDVCDL